jgi:hypothetical protein
LTARLSWTSRKLRLTGLTARVERDRPFELDRAEDRELVLFFRELPLRAARDRWPLGFFVAVAISATSVPDVSFVLSPQLPPPPSRYTAAAPG